MTPEINKTYRLRNGTVGLVDEALESGDFYGTVTAPGTDLRVRVIWTKDGAAKMRNDQWDLTDEMPHVEDDVTAGFLPLVGGEVLQPDPLDRIASALERIAEVLVGLNTSAVNEYGETVLPAITRAIKDGMSGQ